MFQMFEDTALCALEKAEERAIVYGRPYIGTEHLLLGLSYQTETFASHLLRKYGLSAENVEFFLIRSYLKANIIPLQVRLLSQEEAKEDLKTRFLNSLQTQVRQFRELGPKEWLRQSSLWQPQEKPPEPTFTPKLRKIFRKCYLYSYKRADAVTPELLLAILLIREDSFVRDILQETKAPIKKMIQELHFYLRQDRQEHFRMIINRQFVIRFPANEELAVRVVDAVMDRFYEKLEADYYVEIKTMVKNRLGNYLHILKDLSLKKERPKRYSRLQQEYNLTAESFHEEWKDLLQTDAEGRQIYRRYILREKRAFLDKDLPVVGRLLDELNVRLGDF